MKFSQAKDNNLYTLGGHNINSYIKLSVAVMVDFDSANQKEKAQWVAVNIQGKRIRTRIVATIIATSDRNYSSNRFFGHMRQVEIYLIPFLLLNEIKFPVYLD